MVLNSGFPGASGTNSSAIMRANLAGMVARNAAGVVRAGIFPRSTSQGIHGTKPSMAVDVGIFEGVLNRGGPIFIANPSVSTVAIDPAPAANFRWDVVYARQRLAALGDPNDLPEFAVQKGDPGPNAVLSDTLLKLAAAVPGALGLVAVKMPAGATTTQSNGVEVSTIAPYTAMSGGTVAVRDLAELEQWTPVEGSLAYVISLKRIIRRGTTGWDYTTATITYGSLYKNHANYDAPILEKDGTRVRAAGSFTSSAANFAAATTYICGTVPPGFRPPAGKTVLRPAAIAPLQTGWITLDPAGNFRFVMSAGGNLPADGLLVGFDFSYDVPA